MGLINILCCVIIVLFGIVVGCCLASSQGAFRKIREEFKNIEMKTSDYQESLKDAGDLRISMPVEIAYDRKKLEDNRVLFNRTYAGYVVYSQWISLFPLLGILGTVMGLVFNRDMSDVDNLVAGLSMALWTTFFGLVCSILLKFFDAVGPGKLINEIDARFEAVDSAINRLSLEKLNAAKVAREAEALQEERTQRKAEALQEERIQRKAEALQEERAQGKSEASQEERSQSETEASQDKEKPEETVDLQERETSGKKGKAGKGKSKRS